MDPNERSLGHLSAVAERRHCANTKMQKPPEQGPQPPSEKHVCRLSHSATPSLPALRHRPSSHVSREGSQLTLGVVLQGHRYTCRD